MNKYLVETVVTYKMMYVIECEDEEHAGDTVVMDEAEEFSQKFISENILSIREVKDEEIVAMCDRENSYLTEWTDEQKMSLVHRVDYEKS